MMKKIFAFILIANLLLATNELSKAYESIKSPLVIIDKYLEDGSSQGSIISTLTGFMQSYIEGCEKAPKNELCKEYENNITHQIQKSGGKDKFLDSYGDEIMRLILGE